MTSKDSEFRGGCFSWQGKKYYFHTGERLGAGGNGTVFSVEAEGYDGELLVVKIFHRSRKPSPYWEERYLRFVQEIQFLEQHPEMDGILPIIDKHLPDNFPTRRDSAWYVMPRGDVYDVAEGADLLQVLERMIRLAGILKALHAENKAHRDIKPDNLLFYQGKLCLSDWGLLWQEGDRRITGMNEGVGPHWIMPPELEKVNTDAQIDFCKSDVYLFAKVLWMYIKGDDHGFRGPYDRGDPDIYLDSRQFRVRTMEPLHQMMIGATKKDLNERFSIEQCIPLLEKQRYILEYESSGIRSPEMDEEIRQLAYEEAVNEVRARRMREEESYTDPLAITEMLTGTAPYSQIYIRCQTDDKKKKINGRISIRKEEDNIFELVSSIAGKRIRYWFATNRIVWNNEKLELFATVEKNDKILKVGAVSYRESQKPMMAGLVEKIYLEKGDMIFFRKTVEDGGNK